MAVKPSDGAGYAVEDDTFRDEEVQLVHVEPSVSGAMQPAERGGQTIRYGGSILVEPRGQSVEATATTMLVPATVQSRWMIYSIPLLLTNFPKGMNPAKSVTTARNTRGRVMLLRGLVRGVFMRAFFTPEDVVIEAEHVECRQGCDEAHHDTKYRAEHERGGQYFVFTEEPGERGNT